jgi:hypothetical protein
VGDKAVDEIASLLRREQLNFGMSFEDAENGELRVVTNGRSPDDVVSASAGEAP